MVLLDERFWPKTWVDYVNDYLYERDLTIINKKNNCNQITNNQTIMEYASEFIKDKSNKKQM